MLKDIFEIEVIGHRSIVTAYNKEGKPIGSAYFSKETNFCFSGTCVETGSSFYGRGMTKLEALQDLLDFEERELRRYNKNNRELA